MRSMIRVALALGVVLAATAVRAADDDARAARAVLDKALKAMGGADKLAKFQAFTWKSKGSVEAGGQTITISDEWSVMGLDKFRWEVEFSDGNMNNKISLILNGDKGWAVNPMGKAEDAPKEYPAMLRSAFRPVRLVQNPTLLRDKAYKLSSLGEMKIDKTDAVGIKVEQKGQADLDLYFDKKTSLPLKATVRVTEPMGGQEVEYSYIFGAFKDAEGVKHFTRLTFLREGTSHLKVELSDIKPQKKLDDSTFDKP